MPKGYTISQYRKKSVFKMDRYIDWCRTFANFAESISGGLSPDRLLGIGEL